MTDEIIERGPCLRMQRHRQQQYRAGRGHARQLRERRIVVGDVFDDIERADEIERLIGERQRTDHAVDRARVVCDQCAQGRCAQIHEHGIGQRQPGTQARRDFQSSRRCRAQFRHQRPGVEALRLDQLRFAPQLVVEAAIAFEHAGFVARGRVHRINRRTRARCGTSSSTESLRPSPMVSNSSARCGIRAPDAASEW